MNYLDLDVALSMGKLSIILLYRGFKVPFKYVFMNADD